LLSRGGATPPQSNKLLKTGFTAAGWNSASSNMMATSSAIVMRSVAVAVLMVLEETKSAGYSYEESNKEEERAS